MRHQSGHPSPNLIREVFELPISHFFGKYGLADWATNMITAIGQSYGRSGLQLAGEGWAKASDWSHHCRDMKSREILDILSNYINCDGKTFYSNINIQLFCASFCPDCF